jgi:hypothetical protein
LTAGALGAVVRAEVRRQTRRPVTIVGALVVAILLYQPIAYTGPGAKGLVSFGAAAHDAPVLLGILFGRVTLVALFFAALVFGDAGHRDHEERWRSLELSTATPAGILLVGRYLGALLVSVLLFVPGLAAAGAAFGGLDPRFLGPAPELQTLISILGLVVVPTLVGAGALFIGLSVRGGLAPVLVAFVALVALHPVLAGVAASSSATGLLTILDPVGVAPLVRAIRYWSVFERTTLPLPVDVSLLVSRALWACVGLATLRLGARSLRRTVDPSSRLEGDLGIVRRIATAGRALERLPGVGSAAGGRPTASRGPFRVLLLDGLRRSVLHPATLTLAALASVQVFRNLADATVPDGTGVLPVTAPLLGAATNVDEFVLGLTVILSGLLMWRERRDGAAGMVEATPVDGATVVGARLLALFAAQATVLGAAAALTAGFQLSRDAVPDVTAYLAVVGLVELPRYLHWALLAIVAQLLAPGRTTGFVMAAGAIAAVDLGLPALGVTSPLWLYGTVPRHALSAMNGLHPYLESIVAFRLYWLALSLPLFALAARLWRRGPGLGVLERWRSSRDQGAPRRSRRIIMRAVPAAAIGFALFLGIRDAREATAGRTPTEFRAEYERRYRPLVNDPRPELTAVDLDVAFFPGRREARLGGTYTLVNRTDGPLASIDVFHFPILHARLLGLAVDRGHRVEEADEAIGRRRIALRETLEPGDTIRLDFRVVIDPPLVFASGGNPDMVANGSYIDNFLPGRYFPAVGYDPELELTDPAARESEGLGPRALPHPADPLAGGRSVAAPVVRYAASVSAPADQTVVATGARIGERIDGGRRTVRFASDSIRASFAFVAGRYDRIEVEDEGVRLEVYHHPGHHTNVPQIVDGALASLRYNGRFGSYPYDVLRIVEVPDYGHVVGTARAMPTMITWNETGGWLADYRSPEAFPYALATAAHEVAHQWWPWLAAPAAAEGFGVLAEGLPDQARIRVLEGLLEDAAVTRWMRRQRHQYFEARATSVEQPLLLAAQPFVYRNKSQFAFRWASWAGGANAVDRAIDGITRGHRFRGPPYPTTVDLRRELSAAMADSLSGELTAWFDRIVIWDLEVLRARARERAGAYEVEVELSAVRRVVDGTGAEIAVKAPGMVEIGFYDEAGAEVLRLARRLPAGVSSVHVTTPVRPSKVVLDPDELLLDAEQEDDESAIAPEGS